MQVPFPEIQKAKFESMISQNSGVINELSDEDKDKLCKAALGLTLQEAESAFALAIGIAIQNFPEGAIISMPLKSEGISKTKSFLYGTLSGIVEPIGSILTITITNLVVMVLPYVLSFAAGAMIYVVVEELIPESQTGRHSNIGTIGVTIGFVMMMILDVALG